MSLSVELKSRVIMAGECLQAVAGGRCDAETYAERSETCDACDKMERKGEKRFCSACGCPSWRLSELGTKLKMSRAKCPLGKW